MSSIFYNIKKLSFEDKILLIKEAHSLSFRCHVDKLDCSISFARQNTDLTVDDFILLFSKQDHFVFIDRGFDLIYNCRYFEVGASTMNTKKPHYLFIYIDYEKGLSIINNFKLQRQ